MKLTLEEKYNSCVALNIELEEIVEIQNRELMLKDKEISYLKETIALLKMESKEV